jgi:hypothetical protein
MVLSAISVQPSEQPLDLKCFLLIVDLAQPETPLSG